MRFWGIFVSTIALLLIMGSTSAFVSNLENEITVGETPYLLSFKVENKSNLNQPLFVDYDLPTDYEIVKQPGSIRAESEEEIVVKILPQSGFEGTTHIGTIYLEVNGQKSDKLITINYKRENNCTVERQVELEKDEVTIILTNNSYKDKTMKLIEIKGLPSDYELKGRTSFVLNSFERNTYKFELVKGAPFRGELEFVFECQGQTFTNKLEADFEEDGLFSGLAVFGSAMSAVDSAIILDIFLVIIAAILLIAFIARLVRVLNTRGKQTKIEVDN